MPHSIKAIILDAGHGKGTSGAHDPGATGNGTTERKEVLEIAMEARDDFLRQPALQGIQLFLVGVHEDLDINQHIATVNAISQKHGLNAQNSRCIAIHVNKGGGTGMETWFEGGNPASLDFAKNIQELMVMRTNMKDRGVKDDRKTGHGRLGMVRDVIPTACLVECGFIDTKADADKLKDPFKDQAFAQGIVHGICKHLEVKYAEPGTPIPVPSSGFSDVPDGTWFTDAVKKVNKAGIMQGDKGKFRPADTVTRAELAVALARALKL